MNQDPYIKPFAHFAPPIGHYNSYREKITEYTHREEAECLEPLLKEASFSEDKKAEIAKTARQLVQVLRSQKTENSVSSLMQEYALSSQEGIALMCLSEALLRIPDTATRDALIRDKISGHNWKSHLKSDHNLFVNAATWGLVITGRLTTMQDTKHLFSSLKRLVSRCGEPIIRKGIAMAMQILGEHFVLGQTIKEALASAKLREQRGFRYSYDMLGEAALTDKDAQFYYSAYEDAIHEIGRSAQGLGPYKGPGISIKLSALHPRYFRSQADRVMTELYARLKDLALLAQSYNIGLNIDAEEANRLELSLDLFEKLCFDDQLSKFNGLGFVVQAYGRRCPYVLDYLIDLAQRSKHRLMIRLVKGAYWDSEIKWAQNDGLCSYPVFTRKAYTDLSYIACAKKLLAAREVIFPQFATHNAQTIATLYHIAGDTYHDESYEFQLLHGMGEALYDEVIGPNKLNRNARIYAPVGTHKTLLAYLVRRLLENGANSSFVRLISDKSIPIETLIADPADLVRNLAPFGSPHPAIVAPKDLFEPERTNSHGYDLANEQVLTFLTHQLQQSSATAPIPCHAAFAHSAEYKTIHNPADHRDHVGHFVETSLQEIPDLIRHAEQNRALWATTSPEIRAQILEKAADQLQNTMPDFLALLSREAGKTIPNAMTEVREAIDFLRFYAAQGRQLLSLEDQPLGIAICISPWNFPLAIFLGQICAALMAGNVVLAKPAEETPLIAIKTVALLHEAGVPPYVLQLVLGDAKIGASLVALPQIAAVLFTGSTYAAKSIQTSLSERISEWGKPIVLIAETGGQNALIVDSSALPEQVVTDVIHSAFDSAGQRCSALRILCLQEEIADQTIALLKGAMHELRVGRPDCLAIDVGPVISAKARNNITDHITHMRNKGYQVEQLSLNSETDYGTFVPPTLIEIDKISALKEEIFGPVLHVIRYPRNRLKKLVHDINATNYALTFGIHTRINETMDRITNQIKAGNIYINRNIIGAIVGSQPFGGSNLSGTGPKAGGVLYLGRLVQKAPQQTTLHYAPKSAILTNFIEFLSREPIPSIANYAHYLSQCTPLTPPLPLAGPVGEDNFYSLHPRGTILLLPTTREGLLFQIAACLATGNLCAIADNGALQQSLVTLPDSVKQSIHWIINWEQENPFSGALIEAEGEELIAAQKKIAALPGPLILSQAATLTQMQQDNHALCLYWLVKERSVSNNIMAAGGNAKLLTME